jgi:hypothetical protein
MDTNFQNLLYDGPQDLAIDLAQALPDRRRRAALIADPRNLVGDLADGWMAVLGHPTTAGHRFGFRSVAPTVRRFCTILSSIGGISVR